jgi:Protein of unknown function (DUF1353)
VPFAEDDEYGGRTVAELLDDRNWKLLRPLRYTGNRGDSFTVPAGYVTDFASVPRVAVWLIPRFGRYTRAAILHDWLLTDALPAGLVTSVDTDGIFRAVLRELGTPPVKRWLMWTGVRWGAAFNRRRRAGWGSTAPAVASITTAVLGTVLIPAAMILVGAALVLYGVAEAIATAGRKRGTFST